MEQAIMPVFKVQTNFTGFIQGLILAGTLRFNEQYYSLTVYQHWFCSMYFMELGYFIRR